MQSYGTWYSTYRYQQVLGGQSDTASRRQGEMYAVFFCCPAAQLASRTHTMIDRTAAAVIGTPGEPPPPTQQQPKNQLEAARLNCKSYFQD